MGKYLYGNRVGKDFDKSEELKLYGKLVHLIM